MTAGCVYPNCGPSFTFYSFQTVVPAAVGVSSFDVEIINPDTGDSTVHDNSGHGFPLSDIVQPQLALSARYLIIDTDDDSKTHWIYNVTIAVSSPILAADYYFITCS